MESTGNSTAGDAMREVSIKESNNSRKPSLISEVVAIRRLSRSNMPAGRSSGRKFSSQLRPLSLSLRLRKATSTLRPERTPSLRDKRIPAITQL